MIQDISDTFHNEYREAVPAQTDYIMFVQGRRVLIRQNQEKLSFPTFEEVEAAGKEEQVSMQYRYLFAVDTQQGTKCFFLGEQSKLPQSLLEKYGYEPQNVFRVRKPDYMAFAGITACQLANWYASTRYCGTCGELLVHDKTERMMRCPSCQAMHYPRISPAVIVAVTDKDRLLMTKYADRDYKKYALIAGFTEIGETVEETVKREVMEEVGIHVKNIRYYKSQPWSFSDTLLMGFFCELEGEDVITMDAHELAVAEWLHRNEIPTQDDGISLTNEMIMLFKNGFDENGSFAEKN